MRRQHCATNYCRLATMGLVLTARSLVPAPPQPNSPSGLPNVKIRNTVEITSSKRYCWYPTVHRLSTGEILVTVRMGPDERHPEGEFSAYCVSRDGGQTWSWRYTMGAGGNVDAAYSQVPPPDGTLLALGSGYDAVLPFPSDQTRRFQVALTRFARGGMEITQVRDALLRLREPARMVPATLFDTGAKDTTRLESTPEVNPWGAIVEADNGDLLTTVYYLTEKDPRRRRLVLARSPDQGKTWDEYGVIAALAPDEAPWSWMGNEGPNEAAIVRLADRRLYCLFRTGGNAYMGHSWSSDDGKTWSPPASTGIQGVAPHLRRLSDGMLACSYGRPGPVSIMFSTDGMGSAWSKAVEVFRGKSTCYTDLIELESGRLLLVYDSVPYGWHQIPYSDKSARNIVYGTFVEVLNK